MKPETQFLIQLLRDTKPGTLITFDEFSSHIKDDIHKHRNSLTSAIKHVFKHFGLVYVSQPKTGYRLTEQYEVSKMAETIAIGEHKRANDRWGNRLQTVDYKELPESGKKDYIRSTTRLAICEAMLTDEAFELVPQPKISQRRMSPRELISSIRAIGVS